MGMPCKESGRHQQQDGQLTFSASSLTYEMTRKVTSQDPKGALPPVHFPRKKPWFNNGHETTYLLMLDLKGLEDLWAPISLKIIKNKGVQHVRKL